MEGRAAAVAKGEKKAKMMGKKNWERAENRCERERDLPRCPHCDGGCWVGCIRGRETERGSKRRRKKKKMGRRRRKTKKRGKRRRKTTKRGKRRRKRMKNRKRRKMKA